MDLFFLPLIGGLNGLNRDSNLFSVIPSEFARIENIQPKNMDKLLHEIHEMVLWCSRKDHTWSKKAAGKLLSDVQFIMNANLQNLSKLVRLSLVEN